MTVALTIGPVAVPPERELLTCDFSFDVAEEAVPPFYDGDTMHAVPVAPYRKAYEDGEHIALEPGDTMFVARLADRLCGYAIVSRAWNGYGQLDDIAVDRAARGAGVGWRLLDTAVAWARAQGLPGMRLETQSNNVAACRLYARYGFVLGGHDRFLYSALPMTRPETALFWYLLFDQEAA